MTGAQFTLGTISTNTIDTALTYSAAYSNRTGTLFGSNTVTAPLYYQTTDSGGVEAGNLYLQSIVNIKNSDDGSTAAPELILYRDSASPTSGDYIGQVQFKGKNSNGGDEIYAKVTGKIRDSTLGSEDGLIETAIKGNGSFTIVSRQRSDELQLINGTGLDVAGNVTIGGTTTVGGNILTDTTETYDIGSSTVRFNDIYLAGSTVDIGGTKISKDGNGDIDIKDASNNRKTIRAAAIELVDFKVRK